MKFTSIIWEDLAKIYKNHAINALNFEISDSDASDFIKKAIDACEILKDLFKKNEVKKK